jgi:hypothetical protein
VASTGTRKAAPRKAAPRKAATRAGRPRAVAVKAAPALSTHDIQAAVEGVVADVDTVEFCGETFRMSDRIGLMPLMKFAYASSKGIDSADMDGLAAMYVMVRDCIDGPDEWDRFERLAMDSKADDVAIFAVVQQCIEKISARPTRRPKDSSTGPRRISGNSKGSSRSRVTHPQADGLVAVSDL